MGLASPWRWVGAFAGLFSPTSPGLGGGAPGAGPPPGGAAPPLTAPAAAPRPAGGGLPTDAEANGPAASDLPPVGGVGVWRPEARALPDWLQGLRSVGGAASPEALLAPLPTFRAVPKGTADQLGDLYADLVEELCQWAPDSDEEACLWAGVHCLFRWVLWAPTGGLPAHTPAAQREAVRREVVLSRIAMARAGRWELLAEGAAREAKRRASRRAHAPLRHGLEGRALANEVQRRVHKGEWRGAASLLQSRGLAPPTEATRAALQRKLVGGPDDALPPRERPEHTVRGVCRDSLLRALRSAPFASAPGPSGTRFAHLQAMQGNPRALAWLAVARDRLADGNLPDGAVDLLGLTKLTPLLKDGGGIRPVAGGECLRKLTARALVREHRETLQEAVGEHQFGAGRAAGGEKLVHTVQAVATHRPGHAWVQLDIANAFPSVCRRAVLDALAEHAPALLPLAETFLRRPSTFVFVGAEGRGTVLQATKGVEQGDVLGPLLFAVAFRKPVAELRERLLELLQNELGYTREEAEAELVLGAYLDDVLVGLPAAAAARVPGLAAAAFAPLGCAVQEEKTKVWVPNGTCPPACAAWWSPRGLRVLGAPAEADTPLAALGELGAVVGDAGLVASFLEQALRGYRAFTEKVVAATLEADAHWSRVQAGAGLLRLCALPRLLHLFRALPPEATEGFAADADAATLDAYERILTAKLTTLPQQTQAALPTRLGGSGMLRFRDLRAQAWLSSWLATLPAVRGLAGPGVATKEVIVAGDAGWAVSLRRAEEELAAEGVHLDQAGEVVPEEPAAAWGWEDGTPALDQRQRHFSRRRAEAARKRLLDSLPQGPAARLRACGGPGAGAWLLAAPTKAATRLTDLEYKVCARLRLRLPLHMGGDADRCRNRRSGDPTEEPAEGPAAAECGKRLDPAGFHALTCLVGGLVIRRHHALRDLFAAIGREAGYTCTTEVYEPSWTRARTNARGELEVEQARLDNRFTGPPADPLVYGDVVVSHPEASAWLRGAAERDGATAGGAAKGKHARYPAFALPGGRLVPFSVETFGRWGAEALGFLRDAAHATCERSPQLALLGEWGPAALLGTWHCRLSVALQKGNAACLLQAGRVRGAADLAGGADAGWEEDLEDLLREAAAAAAAGNFGA